MKEVDVVLISWAKDEKLRSVTEDAINSLFDDRENVKYNIYVVESNKDVHYDKFNWQSTPSFPEVFTIHPDVPFGYHRYLNIGRRAGKSKYVALCNNDLTFEKGWASEMIRVMEMHPQMKSASPWCPQTQGDNKPHLGKAHVGYTVRKELAGWCIFQQRDIYDTYPNGELDEQFEFWFCDNDYGMTLQKAGIKHLLVPSSVVNHHDGNLGKTGNSAIDDATKQKYTMGQQQTFKNKWG
jgi:GT2 family glycosyltransferase